jgi:hypothetical protein
MRGLAGDLAIRHLAPPSDIATSSLGSLSPEFAARFRSSLGDLSTVDRFLRFVSQLGNGWFFGSGNICHFRNFASVPRACPIPPGPLAPDFIVEKSGTEEHQVKILKRLVRRNRFRWE